MAGLHWLEAATDVPETVVVKGEKKDAMSQVTNDETATQLEFDAEDGDETNNPVTPVTPATTGGRSTRRASSKNGNK